MKRPESNGHRPQAGVASLGFGALGIVFGDIGTSPLYAFRESFDHADLDASTASNALGVASVVVLGADHRHLDQVPRAS